MAKESASPKVKNAKPRRGIHDGDKVVHREKSRKSATSSTSRPPAPGTNYMRDKLQREFVLKQAAKQRQERFQQRIRERGTSMMAILAKKMVSASPSATEELTTIGAAYLGSYTEVADLGWPERHQKAKAAALEGCSPAMRRFAERQLDHAERSTRPAKVAKATDQRKPVAATS